MNQPPQKARSGLGPALLLLVILVDIGLLIWGWYLWQQKQVQLDDSGLNLRQAPQTAQVGRAPAGAVDPLKPASRMKFLPESNPQAATSGYTQPQAQSPTGVAPEQRRKVRAAVLAFFQLKNSPRFKNSQVIQTWKRDFLAAPDLKQLNDTYRQDADAVKFLVHMARSPSFGKLVKEHLQKDDMRAFIKEMASTQEVVASVNEFTADANVAAAVKNLGLKEGSPEPPLPDPEAPETSP
jgi:hypothetical protein